MLRTRAVRWCLIGAAAISTGLIWYWIDSSPLVWSGLIWIAVLTVFSLQSKKPWQRTLLLSAAALVAGIVLPETTLWVIHSKAERQMMEKGGYYLLTRDVLNNWHSLFVEDGPYGLHPTPAVSIEDAAKVGKATVFDVHYTFDQNGLRISPPANSTTTGCVLFFGDSYVWGWGVSDREAAPYQLGLMSGGSLNIYNFGFAAYGVHTMLGQLKTERFVKARGAPRESLSMQSRRSFRIT